MKVGYVPALDRSSGGIYQYSEALFKSLQSLQDCGALNISIVLRSRYANHEEIFKSAEHRVFELYPSTFLGKLARRSIQKVPTNLNDLVRRIATLGSFRTQRRGLGEIVWTDTGRSLSLDVSLLIFPAPDRLAFELGIPSIMAIHDLQHRLQPDWPEFSRREWHAREYVYRNAAQHALILLVDSEVGRDDVLNLYSEHGATSERVKVLPFLPSPRLRMDSSPAEVSSTLQKFSLPDRFLLYPAQFWPHKNHLRLVEAISRVRDRGIHLVLCGSSSGSLRKATYRQVMQRTKELKVDQRISHLGYVSDEDLSALYASATALVFPTFFGPTNIPVIEAWNFGVPVLTSRIRGVTEQVGDAGLLVDPRSVEEMAAGMDRLWTDDNLRRSLVEAGNRRLALYTPEDHRERLGEILAEAAARLDA